ncbi:MAG: tyrosine-type recombinase/integrase [Clostridia bacterium]|nr:tyrosine-type recombinase/integrase [Clostridia bacterium]
MSNYFNQREKNANTMLKNVLIELPLFCFDYFTGIEQNTSILTRLNYAYDLRIFFEYMVNEIPEFQGMKVKYLTVSSLERITATDIERYLSYVSYYEHENKDLSNHERGKARKLASLRSFYKYFFNKGAIVANTAAKVYMPKIHEKEIVRLEVDEVVKILNEAENGANLQGRSKAFNKLTSKRDLAILTLFLGTGIRISELVGLNVKDIDFNVNGFTITRKGGNRVILYFSDEVAKTLADYLIEREELANNPKKPIVDDSALFLSLQNRRISVRAVQNLVKKYSAIAAPLKKISPHKLRSTYGTNLYRETQDIYVVADVLGHKDVNTTKRHYAAISDDIRRNAATKVILRTETKEGKETE